MAAPSSPNDLTSGRTDTGAAADRFRVPFVGLTGGLGSGKSTALAALQRLGAATLSTDAVVHELYGTGEVLDAVVERYMERDLSPEQIAGAGYDLAVVRRVVRLIQLNEYKRRQAPPGVRITPRSFGKDWRYPITSGFRPKA